jgi:hypothetical protein
MFDHASGQLTYVFTPGWCDEIQVGKCTILWAADGVQSGDYGDVITDDEGQAYYVWTASLDYGQQLTATIEYNDSAFDWQQEMDYIQQKQWRPCFRRWLFLCLCLCMCLCRRRSCRMQPKGFLWYEADYHENSGSTAGKAALGTGERSCEAVTEIIPVTVYI